MLRSMASTPTNPTLLRAPTAASVLHVADQQALLRLGRMLRQILVALQADALRVSLLTDDASAVVDLDGFPIDCHYVPHLAGWRAWRTDRFLDAHFPHLPSLIHVWGAPCWAPVRRWAARHDIPLLIHCGSKRDVAAVLRHGPRRGQIVSVACAGLLTPAEQRWPKFARQFRVMRPGFLMPEAREPAGRAERVPGVVWTGRIDADSGLDLLIDAATQLRRRNLDFELALLGRGPKTREVWRKVRENGIQQHVSFVHEPKLWDQALAGTDVCVVPNCQQEISLAPLLAMAQRKVVISSRDQIAEWFVEDQTSWQFTPGSSVELAYHLSQAIEAGRPARALADSAFEYVREHHAASRLTENLISLYEQMLSSLARGTQPEEAPRE